MTYLAYISRTAVRSWTNRKAENGLFNTICIKRLSLPLSLFIYSQTYEKQTPDRHRTRSSERQPLPFDGDWLMTEAASEQVRTACKKFFELHHLQ
ncbi:hypothetical protein CUU66_21310 [Peribacillus deserti]|uniref:Uncharacterized protein n=1 Tax=Peribacillus deserti TaxID=673318 RepID=A0A2N5M0U4_9BACI|nr:hypothetical protein CUU66_21310 [Peribacillus deserti]